MLIPKELLSCCGFVGHKMADGTEVWRGTAFYVSCPGGNPGLSFGYTVTAAHVIQNIIAKGVEKILVRCNTKDGGVDCLETNASDWLLNQNRNNCDVAVLMGVPGDDASVIMLNKDIISPYGQLGENEIGVGADVFWTGLFTSHVGTTRNEPLVRTGHIAALPLDGVRTQVGAMNAYLIDGIPLGGFSGAPVFSNHGTLKTVDGAIRTAKGPIIRLIGMIHGHFNIDQSTVEGRGAADDMSPSLHTGIAVVIRSDDILEMLTHHVIVDTEKKLNDEASQSNSG